MNNSLLPNIGKSMDFKAKMPTPMNLIESIDFQKGYDNPS